MMYWVIQVVKGSYYAYGYKSYKSAEMRFNKAQGGEVFLHQSHETDPVKAVDEFKSGLIRR